MLPSLNKLTEHGCQAGAQGKGKDPKERVCRARGGESCAFDGAMIVLQPIADAAHIVHGPISCAGNSWEGRGSLSDKGVLHKMGFTTDMHEMDIVYGSGEKLRRAIIEVHGRAQPKAVFVYSTCVSGLMGEDIDSVCKMAARQIGIPVIPVNAPGFVGPKNLGNRIAGEVLLDYVIGTGDAPIVTPYDVNLIGEYNIAGDLYEIEALIAGAGGKVLSRLTGNSSFDEVTYAHKARLNIVVCGRALINVAKEMERRYGIPYIEASFFGMAECSRSLRAMAQKLSEINGDPEFLKKAGEFISQKEAQAKRALDEKYKHLAGKKAVLYTGGVKSWSFIRALTDLGVEVCAVGTKKSTFEDEEKMKEILGEAAPLVEDVSPKKLTKLMRNSGADMLIAGGRNIYLAAKEGFPFVDVNQERHTAYAGYAGLLNFARDISESISFYKSASAFHAPKIRQKQKSASIDPLKHSQAIGAAIALQGVHGALPLIHGAQGCGFLGKVLIAKHYREPISLASTKLFTEEVVMGSEEKLERELLDIIQKQKPGIIGVLSSGLASIKGDDVSPVCKKMRAETGTPVLDIPVPDYEGGLETGYVKAVEALVSLAGKKKNDSLPYMSRSINIFMGAHHTPADFYAVKDMARAFGLTPLILPDLSCMDGSREDFSPLAHDGIRLDEIEMMGSAIFSLAIGPQMEPPAKMIEKEFGVQFAVLDGAAGPQDCNLLLGTLAELSGAPAPRKYQRELRVLKDLMTDAHHYLSGKKICLALEPAHALSLSRLIARTGAEVSLAVVPQKANFLDRIAAREVIIGDFSSVDGDFDLLISSSHGTNTALRLGIPMLEEGFPVYKSFGYCQKESIGYKGAARLVSDMANIFLKEAHR
ncbi:MAG: nitrogenase iron-molybdenum cofactor biosynthesis protein NifE [Nitrospiraceae bacterium]|nr:nitrogenase iron-molybdenum cofactor biosynthesis protein NifE [Nitrospiraceae bacterium]